MATKSLGKPIIVNGDVKSLVGRLKESKNSFTIDKPKGQDQLIRKMTSGKK